MMRSLPWFTLALLALPSLASGSGTAPAGKADPPIVPYLCSDGHTASVIYRSEASAEPALAWSLRGEQAVLSEAPEADSYTRPERELLRCVRVRGAIAVEKHGANTHH